MRPDQDDSLTYYQTMEIAVRELLIEKGILTADQIRRQVEDMDSRTPLRGARVVARAWTDAAYKARLLAEATTRSKRSGSTAGPTSWSWWRTRRRCTT